MKYYINNKQVTKEEFYSKRRRKNAHETICYQNGVRSSRWLKFY